MGYLRPVDHEFFERELSSFLPDRIFDVHCHLGPKGRLSVDENGVPHKCGYSEYMALSEEVHPGRKIKAMFIPDVQPANIENTLRANEWISQELENDRDCRGLFFIKPTDDPDWVHEQGKRLGLNGFKCYHTQAAEKPTWEAAIESYLPEQLVRVADKEGWVITLHMVKSRAVADPANIETIRRYCETYPNMKLILAHSARGFQPAHNLEGLPHLTGLDNLYYDTSANCEAMAHEAIMRIIGTDNLMYGTDLPITYLRGRTAAAADSFLWLQEDTPVWGEKHTSIEPVLFALEHLRSVKWACWSQGLSDTQVEDIFWNNATRLLDVG